MYKFQLNIFGIQSQIYYYKTLPAELGEKDKLIMVNGGDIGNTKMAYDIWKALESVNPDIIMIGGDISYDNNLIDCVWTMDYIFR